MGEVGMRESTCPNRRCSPVALLSLVESENDLEFQSVFHLIDEDLLMQQREMLTFNQINFMPQPALPIHPHAAAAASQSKWVKFRFFSKKKKEIDHVQRLKVIEATAAENTKKNAIQFLEISERVLGGTQYRKKEFHVTGNCNQDDEFRKKLILEN